ncbi:hypothetical protein HYFRA_00006208 [Hymenoscyphus fraxineus]|uniref:Uncharacterized protein n=1 Tax=Hymenoscyphus fraxineus TaxID=746836 RepID=A0A9N9PVR8_9HELO|nr:hypothetical protein HYFRA_00006208 [Hymenoscyphus fraxineus]
MAPQVAIKSTVPHNSGAGSKRTSCGTPKEAKRGNNSNGPVVIQSYTELLSCNSGFDFIYQSRTHTTASATWSTQTQIDEIDPR